MPMPVRRPELWIPVAPAIIRSRSAEIVPIRPGVVAPIGHNGGPPLDDGQSPDPMAAPERRARLCSAYGSIMGGGGGGGVTVPPGSPYLWWRMDDVATSGSAITQFNDKSGNSRHAVTGTSPTLVASDSNLNNQPYADFDGTNDIMQIASFNLSGKFLAAAFRLDTIPSQTMTGFAGSGTPLISGSSIELGFGSWNGSAPNHAYVGHGSIGKPLSLVPVEVGAANEQILFWSNIANNIWLSTGPNAGKGYNTTAFGSSATMYIGGNGAGQFFDGRLYEIVAYSGLPSLANQINLFRYLLGRYKGVT